MRPRALAATLVTGCLLLIPADAHAISIAVDGPTGDLVYEASASDRQDVVSVSGDDTSVTFGLGSNPLGEAIDAPGCSVSIDANMFKSVQCPLPPRVRMNLRGGADTVTLSDSQPFVVHAPVVIDGGAGNDTVRGGPEVDTMLGGSGRDDLSGALGTDHLDGGTGYDLMDGGGGVDSIVSRDGFDDRIDCGEGIDAPVVADTIDLLSDCESAELSNALEPDRDHDGFSRQFDCNDDDAAIKPSSVEVPDNGIDENCDGQDGHLADRDGDGNLAPIDCDDGNPSVHPGADEVVANRIDENCDGRDEPFAIPLLTPVASFKVQGHGARTNVRLTRLVVLGVPAHAEVTVECRGRGCPFKRRRPSTRGDRVSLTRVVREARLRRGATLRVIIHAAGYLTAEIAFRAAPPQTPNPVVTCRRPGGRAALCVPDA